ncbi:MAG: phenylacetate--CoA ligase family protein [Rhodocyclaceae bacterium]|nr:phenylacetate--CoA ligase family protein [Rhodocyclaceae bacterium]
MTPAWRLRSVAPGVVWPAIPSPPAAHLLALNFQLLHSQWLPAEELAALQLKQLRQTLTYARRQVPTYADRLPSAVAAADFDWATFRRLPILTRVQAQQEGERLWARQTPADHGALGSGQTSGSTARPLTHHHTELEMLWRRAITLRDHLWHGRDLSWRFATIRAKTKSQDYPSWGGGTGVVAFTGPAAVLSMTEDVDTQFNWLMAQDPDILHTHPTNLNALLQLAERRGLQPSRLKCVSTFSETLPAELRQRLRRVWGLELSDIYSADECGPIALQCPENEHYHVQAEHVLVEVVDEAGQPCPVGVPGRVVITTLHNFAMPLIRYEIGDYAELGPPCACGRGLPVLTRILGRSRNIMRRPDGKSIWPTMPGTLWLAVAPIEQFQVIQVALDSIEVRYAMARPLEEFEREELERLLCERWGYRFRFAWRRVENIPRDAGGKFEDFICRLPADS